MKTDRKTQEAHLNKIRRKAKLFGLHEVDDVDGWFVVPGTHTMIDLTATDPEKIALAVFNAGKGVGREGLKEVITAYENPTKSKEIG